MVVLHTTYFGSVDWYRQIACAKEDVVYIEAHENYVKQTERNRCYIATANGKQALSIPVTLPSHQLEIKGRRGSLEDVDNIRPDEGSQNSSDDGGPDPSVQKLIRNKITEVLISDHGNWRHNHWEALKTAYGMSPFFDYYKDEIQEFFLPLFKGRVEEGLLFDYNLAIAQKMLELLGITKELQPTDKYVGVTSPAPGGRVSYYQTFQRRHGFIPGLSILDLLFNEGPEAIKYLISF